jgi:hypothetical protein
MTDQWARIEALSLRDRLNAEYERYKELVGILPMDKLRLQEDSRRYLCLRCAGLLEQLVFLTVRQYLAKKTSGPALEFANSFFRQAPNLNPKALRNMFGRFGDQDRGRLEEFIDKSREDVLTDLMAVRNPVAHGEAIGGAKIDPRRYVEFCNEFYDWCVDTYLDA